jgi:ribose/xylose/arabinose/galactoside ABC-type transport system permease subunit
LTIYLSPIEHPLTSHLPPFVTSLPSFAPCLFPIENFCALFCALFVHCFVTYWACTLIFFSTWSLFYHFHGHYLSPIGHLFVTYRASIDLSFAPVCNLFAFVCSQFVTHWKFLWHVLWPVCALFCHLLSMHPKFFCNFVTLLPFSSSLFVAYWPSTVFILINVLTQKRFLKVKKSLIRIKVA